jgi:LmbE family N-acetylglucosaminyl deacetylase
VNLGTILGVWAHPDDEAFLSSGLMADAVRKGDRVVSVTATRGELGSWDEERWPSESMGEVREAELEESLAILGVTETRMADAPRSRGKKPRTGWPRSSRRSSRSLCSPSALKG